MKDVSKRTHEHEGEDDLCPDIHILCNSCGGWTWVAWRRPPAKWECKHCGTMKDFPVRCDEDAWVVERQLLATVRRVLS